MILNKTKFFLFPPVSIRLVVCLDFLPRLPIKKLIDHILSDFALKLYGNYESFTKIRRLVVRLFALTTSSGKFWEIDDPGDVSHDGGDI